MAEKKLGKNEKNLEIEKASYFLAFRVIAIAVLCDAIYRSFMLHETPWDLLAIAVVGGLAAILYQFRYKATQPWVKKAVIALVIALILAAVFGVVRTLK
jgi:uncharacterized membrane protein YjjP (DUF1212 family)